MEPVRTTCPYCGVGCGILAEIGEDGAVSIKGDSQHPANFGLLCSKGSALHETLSNEERLQQPHINGQVSDWDTAIQQVASTFTDVIMQHGPDAVAFYVSGQLLTEDYYVANKLMKGFIGSANIDTNSRLCMASAVSGHRRAFGTDTVPCSYEDLELSKLIVITGSNLAWCHPVIYQRIAKARKENPDLVIVVIDPRATATCDIADMHLAIKPGSDTALFNGLLVYLDQHGKCDAHFVEQHTRDANDALKMAKSAVPDVDAVAKACSLDTEQVTAFFRLFAQTEEVITLFSQGVNQWSFGTDKVNAIINCHLLTGRIGRPGAGPFSITGQPNAMGGREVGGLANQLAVHLDIGNEEHRKIVQDFWQSPVIADSEGLKAVELFNAVEQGKVKAIWIMATNPAVSLPDADRVRAALDACDFVVVSDCMQSTDTTQYADIVLPAETWGEKDGTVTNSERCISRQRRFAASPGEAKPDWWIISQVARHMGFRHAFDYASAADIFREYAAMSKCATTCRRDFDISALAALNDEQYDALQPIQWPVVNGQGTRRMFEDGQFYTEDRRARFVPISVVPPAVAPGSDYPLVLNTGRIRDQWHTMTRTGQSARLSSHIFEPTVDLHAADAKKASVRDGELVQVSSKWGQIIVRARISKAQLQGQVFIPMHWNNQYASKSYVDALVNPVTDPVSGQPEFKHTPVAVVAYKAGWYGFILSRHKLALADLPYWSVSRGYSCWRYEIAGDQPADDWAITSRQILCHAVDNIEWIEYFDKSLQHYRAARIDNGQLESCIFMGPDIPLPKRDSLVNLFAKASIDSKDRQSILMEPPSDAQDQGRIICACYQVAENTIRQAIEQDGLADVDAIGMQLRAGTNCGSCVPEIKKLIQTCHIHTTTSAT